MNDRHLLLKGTLLLTLSGFLTKILGFIYRIFLSQVILFSCTVMPPGLQCTFSWKKAVLPF